MSGSVTVSRLVVAVFVLLAFCANLSEAATRNAASCSASAIQSAINSAASGDIVAVPAGNCTFSTTVDVPDGKNITIQGAGSGSTTITAAANEMELFTLNQTSTRITGFTLVNGYIYPRGNDWRVDHNLMTYSPPCANCETVMIKCINTNPSGQQCRGLIDHNTFKGGARVTNYGHETTAEIHAAWFQPTGLGSANMVFVEDNTWDFTGIAMSDTVDENYGGR